MAVATLGRRSGRLLPGAGVALGILGVNAVVVVAVVLHHAGDLVILAVAIPLLVALLLRPQRGILMLVIGVPLTGLLLLVPHPSVLEGWKQFLVIAMLAGTFVAPVQNRGEKGRPRPGWAIGLVPLLGLGVASAAAVGPAQAFFGLRAHFFYLLVAWAVWRCPPNAKERDRLVTALMVIGVLEGFYALLQQFLGPARLHDMGYTYDTTIRFAGSLLRSFGTFETPFGLGFFEMLVLLIGIPHVLSEPRRQRSRWFLLFSPLCVLALGTTVVRGAILGLGAGIAYLGFGRYKVVLLTVPLSLVIALLLPSGVAASAFSTTSSQERGTGWATNLQRLTVHPLGVGIGTTGSAAVKLEALKNGPSPAAPVGTSAYEPDSSWFKVLLELGFLGLWFFALVIVGICTSTHQAAKRLSGVDAAFAQGVSAMVVAAIAAAFFSSYFDLFPMDLFFWMLVAVVLTIPGGGTEVDPQRSRPTPEQLSSP